VTGWKSVYVNKGFTRRINGVTKDESDMLLQYLFNVSQPHGEPCQVCTDDISLSLRTMTLRFASSGTRTIWPSGTIGRPGIARHTTMRQLGLETESVVWAKAHILTFNPSPGDKLWPRINEVHLKLEQCNLR
jgi:hypothetical protein